MVTFVFGIFIYLLLFLLTFSAEVILHTSEVSFQMFFHFLNMYLLEGIGVFLAVSPIIALVPYWKKSYWLAMVLAELYSFAGLFMSMSPVLKTFYPISAIFWRVRVLRNLPGRQVLQPSGSAAVRRSFSSLLAENKGSTLNISLRLLFWSLPVVSKH